MAAWGPCSPGPCASQSLGECHLSRVKRGVIGTAQKNSKLVPGRILRKILVRNRSMFLQPVFGGKPLNS